ncbi:MAG: hypothetical protein ACTHLW_07535 [Verrucomicrobiota bacterium]
MQNIFLISFGVFSVFRGYRTRGSTLPSSNNIQNVEAVASLNNPPSNQKPTSRTMAPARQVMASHAEDDSGLPMVDGKAEAHWVLCLLDLRTPET